MNVELIAVLITSFVEVLMLVYVASLEYRTRDKMNADDAALYLQGRRIQEILEEMRRSLVEERR